ncbi:MAG TPA: diguanylate cyclase, partial [Planctomycetaceae bacterium]|nr:diguanylate cyclase [Planctomycetaceae bacterium]
MVINVLLVEGDPVEARALLAALADPRAGPCYVEWASSLGESLELLKWEGVSAILLDLFLPDSQGLETLDRLLQAAPHIPVLVLSNPIDEGLAGQAVIRGARDYVIKGHLGGYSLPRTLQNIIARHLSEDASFLAADRTRATLDSIGDAVLSIDVAGNVSYLNRVAERMTGWSREEAEGRKLAEIFQIVDSVTREPAPNPLAFAIQENRAVSLTMNCVLIGRDGQESAIEDTAAPIHDGHGEITGAVVVFHDVNASRAQSVKLSHLAQHDPLTDLPNRSLLTERLTQAISLAGRHDRQLAVLFLDLDHFKNVNDTLGHAIGDKLLQSV